MKIRSALLLAVLSGSVVQSSNAWNNHMMLFASPFQQDAVACRTSQDDSACSPIGRMIREQEKIFDQMENEFPFGRSSRGSSRRRTPMMELMEKQSDMLFPTRNQFLNQVGIGKKPQYEVTHTDQDVKIALDMPGIKAEDIDVSVDSETRILTIVGTRDVQDEGYRFTSKISESFHLNPTIDIQNIAVSFQDGVLVVRATKKEQETTVRRIPIDNVPSSTVKQQDNEEIQVTMSNTENIATIDATESRTVKEEEETETSNGDDDEVIDLSDDQEKTV